MKNILVVGSGHVGLVTGVCFADLGNRVVCHDDDGKKISDLKNGVIPFYEPGLAELVQRNVQEERLSFTDSLKGVVNEAEVIFICVGTPQRPGGEADLSYVENAARSIAAEMNGYKIIVEKSTVPVKTGGWVRKTVEWHTPDNYAFDVVSNPEFLREGNAIHDFMYPDRIVIGAESESAARTMTELYQPLNSRVLVTNIETAELIKHTSNVFLALKISYINLVANVCESVGADVVRVAEGVGLDKRIGMDFLNAGAGYGGYCFPKDLTAFTRIAEEANYNSELLRAISMINEGQMESVVKKVKNALWNLSNKTIAVLGLSYKADTDDMREAPSVHIVERLQEEGARIKAYDPHAMEVAKTILRDVEYCQSPYEAAVDSDALVIVTDWAEFRDMDMERIMKSLKQPVIIDGRNIFQPDDMNRLGFIYRGMGR